MTTDAVRSAWDDAVRVLGGVPGESGPALVARYRTPPRSYHGLAHVAQVVRDADLLAAALGLGAHDRAVVALAACAHDVVYDSAPGDDERASAAWAQDALQACGANRVPDVARLVLATVEHAPDPEDLLAAALMDADLAVLGGDEDAYDAYAAAVRAEYAAFDDATWAAGRAHVLRDLLGRPQLFTSRQAQERWDAAARRNLARELATLQG